MDDFEETCISIGGKTEELPDKMKACIIKDVAILENGEMLPFGESKKE
jgi:hypothetical protein